MIFAWFAIAVVAILALLLLALHLKGRTLPAEHTAFAVLRLEATADEVWRVIADAGRQPEWMKGISRVDRLPDRDGHTAWKMVMGRNAFTLEETVSEPPRRLVREIRDVNGPFSGSWEFLLIPVPSADPARPAAVKVRLTERGRISSTIPRAVMHAMGEDMYLKKYLSSLAKKFGQPAGFSND